MEGPELTSWRRSPVDKRLPRPGQAGDDGLLRAPVPQFNPTQVRGWWSTGSIKHSVIPAGDLGRSAPRWIPARICFVLEDTPFDSLDFAASGLGLGGRRGTIDADNQDPVREKRHRLGRTRSAAGRSCEAPFSRCGGWAELGPGRHRCLRCPIRVGYLVTRLSSVTRTAGGPRLLGRWHFLGQ